MSVKFYVTSDFIKDCMDPNRTIRLFGAKFNIPSYGANPTATNPYKFDEGNLQDYNSTWYKVDTTDNNSAIKLNNLTNGEVLPCTINEDRSKVHVKIPWISDLLNQQIGYLTYFTEAKDGEEGLVDVPDEFKGLTEKVGLVFESKKYNIGIQRARENPLDSNSYITVDLSKFNISANILPLRYKVVSTSSSSYDWGIFDDEHLHNLTLTNENGFTSGVTGESVTELDESFIDTKSLKDGTMKVALDSMNTYSSARYSDIESSKDSYVIAEDGRYVNSSDTYNNGDSIITIETEISSGVMVVMDDDQIEKSLEVSRSAKTNTGATSPNDYEYEEGSGFLLEVTSGDNEAQRKVADVDLYDVWYI